MAQTYNMQLDQGSTYNMQVLYLEPDPGGGPAPTPVDLGGWEARMKVRESVGAATLLAEFTSSPAAGLTMGGALYDPATAPEVVHRLVQGRFLVNKEV